MIKQIRPIFLFSLPRSGSTLLQRVLAAHDEIATTSEPHLLLPFLYSNRKSGLYAEYGQELAARGIEGFCAELPRGAEDYLEEIEALALRLYAKAMKKKGQYFLDKTPRYTLVVDEIMRTFRQGKFVVLVRHPLAVISSMLGTFKSGRWCAYAFNADLFTGLPKLIAACSNHPERVHLVRYEELVKEPQAQCRLLDEYLGLSFDERQLSGFTGVEIKGLGDQAGIRNYSSISEEPLEKWKRALGNPLRKAWCRRYLHWIGSEGWRSLGYDLESLLAELDQIPSSLHMLGSDLIRMPYGVLYRLLEPKLMVHKCAALTDWHKVHPHY